MATQYQEPQHPLVLRAHRLMEAFAKSDDERDFYLDRQEGFIVYLDLEKSQEEVEAFEAELKQSPGRYCLIPKMTFYEIKKIMESFVNEKVYDIDTKEKLLDIIQSKEAREHFLEFINDHHSEFEKWQQFYQERSRIRIIEWLRTNHFHFVFEEDLELPSSLIEKVKEVMFEEKVNKDIQAARKTIVLKSKTYYSSEALNPRPKRGRPPKQAMKMETEQQISKDIYLTVPPAFRPFLFSPDLSVSSDITFSSKFEGAHDVRTHAKSGTGELSGYDMTSINKKLEELRNLSKSWTGPSDEATDFSLEEDDDDDLDDSYFDEEESVPKKAPVKKAAVQKPPVKQAPQAAKAEKAAAKPAVKKAEAKPSKAPVKELKKTNSKKKNLLRRTNKKKEL